MSSAQEFASKLVSLVGEERVQVDNAGDVEATALNVVLNQKIDNFRVSCSEQNRS